MLFKNFNEGNLTSLVTLYAAHWPVAMCVHHLTMYGRKVLNTNKASSFSRHYKQAVL